MEHYSYEKGYNSILCITGYDSRKEKSHIETLKSKIIDGYIILPNSITKNNYSVLFKGENVVSIDICMGVPDEICVKSNNFLGIKLAVDYLLSLGHSRIGVINIPIKLQTGYERYNAYKKVCRQENINLNERLIKFVNIGRDSAPDLGMIESAKEKTLEIMSQEERPTAIISTGVYISIGILRAFTKMGTNIPEDISFISFDELYEYSDLFKTGITTIKQPAKEIGALAIELLLKKIEGTNPKPGIFELEPELVKRESCKRL